MATDGILCCSIHVAVAVDAVDVAGDVELPTENP